MNMPKALPCSRERLEKIASDIPTPFHLYDETVIRERARLLHQAFAWNAGFKEFFAVKATPTPAILRILREEGCGVDCSSLTELMLAHACGFRGDEIMFSSNVTPEADMRLAAQLNSLISLDDLSHVDFLDRVAGTPGFVMLRYNPGPAFRIGNHIMSKPEDAKYGMTREQLISALVSLRERGCRNFGVHAFLSSNTCEEDYYPALAEMLFRLAVDIRSQTGIALCRINLSGGIGVPYRPEALSVDILRVGQRVRALYESILLPAGLQVGLCSELGRWLLAPAGCLVARVLHEKHIYKDYLGLDACAADLMRPAMYGAYHHITVVGQEGQPAVGTWDVAGGLCENNDKFAVDRPLPPVGLGDLVVIHDTGAHGRAMGYNYNGKLRSAEVLLQSDGSHRLIRRAESPADYFATLEGIDGFHL
jgi:diaminopimelate decarboxylase